MAAEVGKIQFKVGLKNQNGVKKEVQSLQSDISSKLTTSFGKLGAAIGAAFSIAAIIQFSKACHEGYVEAQEFELKLATIMRKRMNSTDDAIQKTKELTDALEQVGVVDGAFALAGAQQLATFLNTEEALNTLIPAMENLVAQQKGYNATSQDMVTIANLFGKVMQGQTSALNRVGITFSEAQEQALKLASEEERAAILAEIITDNVGNMNEILGDTPTGKLKQLEYAFGGIMDNVGAIVESIIYPFLDGLYTIVQYLNQATAKLAEFAQMWAGISGVTLPSVSSSLGEVEEGVEEVGKAANKTAFGFDNLNKLTSASASGGGSTLNKGGGELTNLTTPSTTTKEIGFKFNFNESELENIRDIVGNVTGTFENLGEIAGTLGGMFKTAFDIVILEPFKNHSEDIRNVFDDILEFTEQITKSFENFTDRASEKMEEFANGRFKTACEEMGNDLDNALETFFTGYDEYIEPTFDLMYEKIENVFGEGGTLDQALDTILEDIAIVMENCGWLMELLANVGIIAGIILAYIGTSLVGIIGSIVKSVEAGFDLIAGLALIIEGIFTGTFDKIKEGFALIIEAFLKQLQSILMGVDALVGTDFASSLDSVIESVSQPNVGPSSRDRQFTSHNSLSGGGGRRRDDSSYTIVLDKYVVGQVTNQTNTKNQWVMG